MISVCPRPIASVILQRMTHADFRDQLLALNLSDRPEETAHRAAMLELLDRDADCFSRTCFPAHFTGSALVVSANGTKALLNHHRKLDRWLPFSGHCDAHESVLQTAQREAREESGIEGLILASSRPFDLDVHPIPRNQHEPEHFHYDVRYVLIAPEGAQFEMSVESVQLKWFSTAEAAQVSSDAGFQRLITKWSALLSRRSSHAN